MENDEVMKQVIRLDAIQHIKKCWKVNGIEGTEQIIAQVYELMPTLKDHMLNLHRELVKGVSHE